MIFFNAKQLDKFLNDLNNVLLDLKIEPIKFKQSHEHH